MSVPLIDPLDEPVDGAAADEADVDVLLVWTFVCTGDMLWGSSFDVTELHMSNILDVYMTTQRAQRISTPPANRPSRTARGSYASVGFARAVDGGVRVVAARANRVDTGEPARTKRKERKYTVVAGRTTHRWVVLT